MGKHISLTRQTTNMNDLLEKGIAKNWFASGLLVTVTDLSGSDIIHDALIYGEYSKEMFGTIGQLLLKSMQESINFHKRELMAAEKSLEKAQKILYNEPNKDKEEKN